MQSLTDTIKPLINKQPKTYCFGIDIRLLFLVNIAKTAGINMNVERQGIAN